MFGMGGSVVASIHLAQGKPRIAAINITQAVVLPTLAVLLLSAATILSAQPLLGLLGTPPELLADARRYLVCFALFLAPLALFNILMFIVRLDGSPRFAMAANLVAAGLNILLDYLFIFVFGWGLPGAAIATGIGYIVGVAMMLRYMRRRSRTLRFVQLKLSSRQLASRVPQPGLHGRHRFPGPAERGGHFMPDGGRKPHFHPLCRQGRGGGLQRRLLPLPHRIHGL